MKLSIRRIALVFSLSMLVVPGLGSHPIWAAQVEANAAAQAGNAGVGAAGIAGGRTPGNLEYTPMDGANLGVKLDPSSLPVLQSPSLQSEAAALPETAVPDVKPSHSISANETSSSGEDRTAPSESVLKGIHAGEELNDISGTVNRTINKGDFGAADGELRKAYDLGQQKPASEPVTAANAVNVMLEIQIPEGKDIQESVKDLADQLNKDYGFSLDDKYKPVRIKEGIYIVRGTVSGADVEGLSKDSRIKTWPDIRMKPIAKGSMSMQMDPAQANVEAKIEPSLRQQLDQLQDGQTATVIILTTRAEIPKGTPRTKIPAIFRSHMQPALEYLGKNQVEHNYLSNLGMFIAKVTKEQAFGLASIEVIRSLTADQEAHLIR